MKHIYSVVFQRRDMSFHQWSCLPAASNVQAAEEMRQIMEAKFECRPGESFWLPTEMVEAISPEFWAPQFDTYPGS